MTALADPAVVRHWLLARRDRWSPEEVLDLRVEAVQQLSRGVSRETWAVDVTATTQQGRASHALVVRRDHPAGSVIPTSLEQEHAVYRGLSGTGLPVARALWFEDEPALQPDGRPAYVRERVDGDWHLPFLAEDGPAADEAKVAASREHLAVMARVHAVDWRAAGLGDVLPVPASAEQAAEHLVRSVRTQVEELLGGPTALLSAACAALLRDAPRDLDRLRLCKGTNGHGEEVWRDGRVVALSDWELARIGDPAYDLAQLQELVPTIVRDGRQVWGWDQALEHYASCSGTQVTLRRLEWYRSAYGLLQLAYTANAAAVVRRLGAAAPVRFAWAASEVRHHAERRLVALVEGAA